MRMLLIASLTLRNMDFINEKDRALAIKKALLLSRCEYFTYIFNTSTYGTELV